MALRTALHCPHGTLNYTRIRSYHKTMLATLEEMLGTMPVSGFTTGQHFALNKHLFGGGGRRSSRIWLFYSILKNWEQIFLHPGP